MKVTFICGSNRRKGNTSSALELIAEEIHEKYTARGGQIETEFIHLGKFQIEMCTGCRTCFDRGEEHCPLKDDVQAIITKMQAADLLVFASPVYVSEVSGLMKNWMDRLAYICHRPSFAGKPAYVIATTGGSPCGQAIKTIQGALLTWGFHLCGSAGFVTGARMKKEEIRQRYSRKIQKVADKIVNTLDKIPGVKPSIIELVVFQIQQHTWKKADKDSLDYQHWYQNGWLEPTCAYYCSNQANIFSILTAQLAGGVVNLFF